MKSTKYSKALELMSGDYILLSDHSNMFIMMSKKEETDWENSDIAQYMGMEEDFLDFEIERRKHLTKEEKSEEFLHWMLCGCRKDPVELVVAYFEARHIPYDLSRLNR